MQRGLQRLSKQPDGISHHHDQRHVVRVARYAEPSLGQRVPSRREGGWDCATPLDVRLNERGCAAESDDDEPVKRKRSATPTSEDDDPEQQASPAVATSELEP
jgi:hypothetical protein